jgi:ABC-type phosphate/phosphonate transport system substrate-binding protein
MPLFASLPWYDLQEIRWATDLFWGRLREHLRARGFAAPSGLERELDCFEQWRRPDLLLSQACGYDVRIAYAQDLQLVATPRYRAPGCEGPLSSSFVVVREDAPYGSLVELRGCRCAINTPTSHSGMNILRSLVAPLHENGRFFASVRVSGAHTASLRRIVAGDADVAAIDCVTYELLRRHRPGALAGTRILASTEAVAAPPFVARAELGPDGVGRLRAALADALEDPLAGEAREAMLLDGAEPLGLEAYQRIADLDALARELAYSDLDARADAGASPTRAQTSP